MFSLLPIHHADIAMSVSVASKIQPQFYGFFFRSFSSSLDIVDDTIFARMQFWYATPKHIYKYIHWWECDMPHKCQPYFMCSTAVVKKKRRKTNTFGALKWVEIVSVWFLINATELLDRPLQRCSTETVINFRPQSIVSQSLYLFILSI